MLEGVGRVPVGDTGVGSSISPVSGDPVRAVNWTCRHTSERRNVRLGPEKETTTSNVPAVADVSSTPSES